MRLLGIVLFIICHPGSAQDKMILTLPYQQDGGHYLLQIALTDAGYNVTISIPREHIPKNVLLRWLKLGNSLYHDQLARSREIKNTRR